MPDVRNRSSPSRSAAVVVARRRRRSRRGLASRWRRRTTSSTAPPPSDDHRPRSPTTTTTTEPAAEPTWPARPGCRSPTPPSSQPRRRSSSRSTTPTPTARPQAGLNQADIVFEEAVEGGITRLRRGVPLAPTPTRSARCARPARTDIDLARAAATAAVRLVGRQRRRRRASARARRRCVDVGFDAVPAHYYRDGSRRGAAQPLRPRRPTLCTAAGAAGRGPPPRRCSSYRQRRRDSCPTHRPRSARACGSTCGGGSTRRPSARYDWDRAELGPLRRTGTPHVDADGSQVIAAATSWSCSSTYRHRARLDARIARGPTRRQGEAWVLHRRQASSRARWSRAVDRPAVHAVHRRRRATRSSSRPAARGSSCPAPTAPRRSEAPSPERR